MIRTPQSRAELTRSFTFGARTPIRSVAPSHQCLSHISITIRAIFLGSVVNGIDMSEILKLSCCFLVSRVGNEIDEIQRDTPRLEKNES